MFCIEGQNSFHTFSEIMYNTSYASLRVFSKAFLCVSQITEKHVTSFNSRCHVLLLLLQLFGHIHSASC